MFKKMLITILSCAAVATTAVAKEQKVEDTAKEIKMSEHLAIGTAFAFNTMKNVDGYLNWISVSVSKEESKKLEAYLKTIGLNREMKFPKMTAKGNMVFFDEVSTITFTEGDHLFAFGKKITQSKKSLTETVKDVCKVIGCKNNQVAANFFIPEAHAAISRELLFGLGGAAIGALAYKDNRLLGGGIGLLGGLLVENLTDDDKSNDWLGSNIFAFNDSYYNGRVRCRGPLYELHRNTPSTYFGHNGRRVTLPPQHAQRRGYGRCNEGRRRRMDDEHRILQQYELYRSQNPGRPVRRTPPEGSTPRIQ